MSIHRDQRDGDAAAFAEQDVVGAGSGGRSHDLHPDPLPFQRLAEGLRHMCDLRAGADEEDVDPAFQRQGRGDVTKPAPGTGVPRKGWPFRLSFGPTPPFAFPRRNRPPPLGGVLVPPASLDVFPEALGVQEVFHHDLPTRRPRRGQPDLPHPQEAVDQGLVHLDGLDVPDLDLRGRLGEKTIFKGHLIVFHREERGKSLVRHVPQGNDLSLIHI